MRTFAQIQNRPQQRDSITVVKRGEVFNRSPEDNPILNLQRTAGNQAVLRLLHENNRSDKQDSDLSPRVGFGHVFSRIAVWPDGAPTKRAMDEEIRRKEQAEPGASRSVYGPGDTSDFAPPGAMAGMGLGCLLGLGGCRPDSGPDLPWVEVGNFRNSNTTSVENKCGLCPQQLGVLPGAAHNAMELRGTITGHVPEAQYEFRREATSQVFTMLSSGWFAVPSGPKNDDAANDDEYLTPINDHIYVIDKPGNLEPQNPTSNGTEWVQKLNMTEWVEVRIGSSGPWTKQSNSFTWHSVVWLEKVAGVWRTNEARSEIAPGHIDLETKEP